MPGFQVQSKFRDVNIIITTIYISAYEHTLLKNFQPMFHFYSPFSDVFRGAIEMKHSLKMG